MLEMYTKVNVEEPEPANWNTTVPQISKEKPKKIVSPVVLVTGGYGFAASSLIKLMLNSGVNEVHAVIRRNSDNYRHKEFNLVGHPNLHLHFGDIMDEYSIRKIINDVRPDLIFNLAAIMYIQDSWDIPSTTFQTNTMGVLYILKAMMGLKKIGRSARLVQASTSECYGDVFDYEVPITEENVLRPKSPYGISKVAAEHLCKIYAKQYGLDIIITRAFNHVGKTQNNKLVIPAFARRLVKAYYEDTIVKHGNLEAIRDFTDVDEIVEAYWMLGNMKVFDTGMVINICSGKDNSMSMGEIMQIMIEYLRILFVGNDEFNPILDPAYVRPNDVELLVGDNTMINELIGWKPKKLLKDIIIDMVNKEVIRYES